MSKHKDLFDTVARLEVDETPYAIATVFMVQGSSSGKVGDKALYDKSGRRIIGYIGGGCIENRVAATAREAIRDGEPKETALAEAEVEYHDKESFTIWVKFKVVIQTPEEEADRYPEAERIITDPLEMDDIDFDVDYFVLATHHRDDDRISCEALKRGIPYVAVVASGKKTGIITDYLREHGITDEDLERFHAPAGLDLEAKTAEEIALSILSEMVMHRNGGTGHPMRTMVSEENVPEQQP